MFLYMTKEKSAIVEGVTTTKKVYSNYTLVVRENAITKKGQVTIYDKENRMLICSQSINNIVYIKRKDLFDAVCELLKSESAFDRFTKFGSFKVFKGFKTWLLFINA